MNPERKRIAEGMGRRVRAVRIAMGYESIDAFARFLGVPASHVRRCEHGHMAAGYKNCCRAISLGIALCEKAGFTLDWFFLGKPQQYPPAPLDVPRKPPQTPAHD